MRALIVDRIMIKVLIMIKVPFAARIIFRFVEKSLSRDLPILNVLTERKREHVGKFENIPRAGRTASRGNEGGGRGGERVRETGDNDYSDYSSAERRVSCLGGIFSL